jgi:hypothetical protein
MGRISSMGVIRIKREELYEQVWAQPLTTLAASYGISDVGLRKICNKLKVPLPGRGFWRRISTGSRLKKSPLPSFKGPTEYVLRDQNTQPESLEWETETQRLIRAEKDGKKVVVSRLLESIHPVSEKTLKILRSAKKGTEGLVAPKAAGCMNIYVAPENIERAVLIMDALVRAFESRGFRVAAGAGEKRLTKVSVLGEEMIISISESFRRKERELTPRELKRQEREPWLYRNEYSYQPTGELTLTIHNGEYRTQANWSDGKRKIEERLGSFIVGLIKAAHGRIENRLRREREEREWEERRRIREEKARRYQEEKTRLQVLEQDAKNWHKSQRLRAYIEAVRQDAIRRHGAVDPAGETDRWITWATAQADRLDPLVESPPSILDEWDERRDGYSSW